MAGNKYVALVSGLFQEVAAILTSSGSGDANKIPGLDSTGRLDQSFMPVGILPETKLLPTSENLSAGNMVNIYDNGGTVTARKSDSSNGFRADGFVLAATTSPANATVYLEGINTQLSGLTVGVMQFIGTGGAVTDTAPSTSGYLSQQIGVSLSATELSFEPQAGVTLA